MSYFHLQPFSLSPHLLPPSLVLFGSSFSFVESFPYSFVRIFPVRFSLVYVLFIIGGRFSSCSGSFSFGLRFLFRLHCSSSPSLAPSSVSAPLLRCFCYTCCFCLLGGSPLTCFSFALSFLLSAVPYQLPVALTILHLPSHLLTASLGVQGAVPCASFFLSPFFSSRLLSGWRDCSSFGSLIHGVSFPLAVFFTCLGGRFLWLRC